jgi:hypothetical protein
MYSIPKKLNVHGQPRNYSLLPFIGGVAGTIGCRLAPSQSLNQLWWVPLLIDPGCALLLGLLSISLAVSGIKWLRGR